MKGPIAVAVSFTINGADLAGNALAQVTAVTDGSSMTFDKTAPTLSAVVISSDNDAASLAKPDNTITLTITASETILAPTCVFKTATTNAVAGAVTVDGSGTGPWTCAVDVATGDTTGDVSFTIDGTDLTGNALEQVTSATDGSSVTYDDESPTLSAVSISSDNAAATWAKVNDTITLNITSSEDLSAPTCAFATASDAVTGPVTVFGSGTDWTCEVIMTAGDSGGAVSEHQLQLSATPCKFMVSLVVLAQRKREIQKLANATRSAIEWVFDERAMSNKY